MVNCFALNSANMHLTESDCMKHLILDSNIFHQHPELQGQPFKLLKRLVEAGLLKLLVPYIVEKEFVTKRTEKYEKQISDLECAVGTLAKLPLSEGLSSWLTVLKGEIDKHKATLLSIPADRFEAWLQSNGAERMDICQDQAVKALDAYFHGTAPLKKAKVRDDIPDSFIFQAVEKVSLERGDVIFISNDGALREAVAKLPNVQVFKNLWEFTDSSGIQDEIAWLDAAEEIAADHKDNQNKTQRLRACITESELADQLFSDAVKMQIGEKILWETIEEWGEDAEEATITSYGDADNPSFLWNELSYLGEDNFTLPFVVTVNVSITYYILKSTWCSLDEHEAPSVTDHNDHYFEAEAEVSVNVDGVLSFSLFSDASPGDEDSIDDESIEIESILSIE